jgi:hypothetical protein
MELQNKPPIIDIENTSVALNFKTIGAIITGVAIVVGMYYSLVKEIDIAKTAPISRVEFDLKAETTNTIVKETQGHIKDGHTTLYLMLLKEFEKLDKHIYELETKVAKLEK